MKNPLKIVLLAVMAAVLALPAHASAATTSCPRVTSTWHHDGPWHVRKVSVQMTAATARGLARRLPVEEGSRTTPAEVPCGVGSAVSNQMGRGWTGDIGSYRYGISEVFWTSEGAPVPIGKFYCTWHGIDSGWVRLSCRTKTRASIKVNFEFGDNS